MKDMWEERYAADEYAYGEEPNAFFKACLDRLPAAGRLLLPGEGEGRNAVYAARQGWKVDAFDFSAAGRERALRLAERYGVHIDYEVADYETARIEPEAYSKEQLAYGTGGPPNAKLLYTLEDLREDFSDLEIVEIEKVEAEIHEGRYHTGLASAVRLVARR